MTTDNSNIYEQGTRSEAQWEAELEQYEIASIRWTLLDVKLWLTAHHYPVDEENMRSIRKQLNPSIIENSALEDGWMCINALIDPARLHKAADQVDNDSDSSRQHDSEQDEQHHKSMTIVPIASVVAAVAKQQH